MRANVKESVQEHVSDVHDAMKKSHTGGAAGGKMKMMSKGRHLLGDKSSTGWHEAKATKRAAKHSRWAEWIKSKFARKQAVKAAVHEHVAESVSKAADWAGYHPSNPSI